MSGRRTRWTRSQSGGGAERGGSARGLATTIAVAVAVLALGVGSAALLAPGAGLATEDGGEAGGGADAVGGPADGDGTASGAEDRAATVVGTDATDSDGDGLADAVEREVYGTDPTESDTDGDGYPDGAEVACSERLPGADPLSQDLYVELDAVAGAEVSRVAVAIVEDAFQNAPVENPDGSTGIDLHVRRSDAALPADGSVNSHERPGEYDDVLDYREAAADFRGDGHYYVLAAPNVAYRGDDFYVGAGRPGLAAVEPLDSPELTASLVLHELGHAFGLDRDQDGIDEDAYSRAEYDSVMNYNALYEVTHYSDGTDEVGRDEWDYVAEDRHVPAFDCGDATDCPATC